MNRRPTTFAVAIVAACALGSAACGPSFDMGSINAMIASAQATQRQQGNLGGQVGVASAGEPTWTFAPSACKSGQLEGFYGVDLASTAQNGAVLRLVEDPIEGPRLRLRRVTARGVVETRLDSSQCSALELSVQREGVSYNGVAALDGALVLDCRAGGQNLAGTIRFAGCHRSPIVDSVTASLAAEGDANAPPATQVPEATPLPPLPPELSALSVRLEPRIVGVLAGGETVDQAERACLDGERRFAHQLGWRVVDGGAAPDLVAQFGCTGHVALARNGSRVTMTVPHDGTPSLVLREGEHVVATVPPGPVRYTCESSTADPESDCSRRVSQLVSARLVSALAASAELREFVRRPAPSR